MRGIHGSTAAIDPNSAASKQANLFNAFFLETLNERNYLALFSFRHLELGQSRCSMP
jgi:hypothetical protein